MYVIHCAICPNQSIPKETIKSTDGIPLVDCVTSICTSGLRPTYIAAEREKILKFTESKYFKMCPVSEGSSYSLSICFHKQIV